MAGSLGSTDITPLRRYYGPGRHLLVFGRFPGVAGYTAYLAPAIFSPGRGGFLQLLSMSLSPCCRFHPAEMKVVSVSVRLLMLPSPMDCGLGPRTYCFRGHNAFSFDTAR